MQIMQFSKRELNIIYDALAYKCKNLYDALTYKRNNDNLQEKDLEEFEDVYIRIKAAICLEDNEAGGTYEKS